MRKRVNILIGRFQPITKGHIKCIDRALEEGLPTVLCMIDTADDKVDERHPFPSSMILPLYKAILDVEDVVLVRSADIVSISQALKDYEIASWTCGTDRVKDYERMANRYKTDAGLAEDFHITEIPRDDSDISATKAREALLEGDEREFYKLFPNMSLRDRLKYDVYNVLRKQIMNAYEKKSH